MYSWMAQSAQLSPGDCTRILTTATACDRLCVKVRKFSAMGYPEPVWESKAESAKQAKPERFGSCLQLERAGVLREMPRPSEDSDSLARDSPHTVAEGSTPEASAAPEQHRKRKPKTSVQFLVASACSLCSSPETTSTSCSRQHLEKPGRKLSEKAT